MTIIDHVFEFCDAQDIASGTLSATSSVLSEDVVDLGADQQDGFFASVLTTRLAEQAKPLVLLMTIDTTFVNTASGTVLVELISRAADATITDSDTIHATLTIPTGSVAGTQFVLPIPWDAYGRFLGVYFTAVTGNLTTGKINAHMVEAGQLID